MRADDKINILLVDDQPAKLLSYEVILRELGENLITAASGREALQLLLKNEIAVILVDVSMPELDGFPAGGDGARASPLPEDRDHLRLGHPSDRDWMRCAATRWAPWTMCRSPSCRRCCAPR